MAWLTIEVAIIALNYAITGVIMLIAKSPRSWKRSVLQSFSTSELKAELEKRENGDTVKSDKGKGKKG